MKQRILNGEQDYIKINKKKSAEKTETHNHLVKNKEEIKIRKLVPGMLGRDFIGKGQDD